MMAASFRFVVAWLLVCSLQATAADLSKVDRSIAKEPAYQSKTPKYGLLVFGEDAADRLWLVHDGETLYVDRNGNGDLTEAEEKIGHNARATGDPREDGYTFVVGDISVGGKVHKELTVQFVPLKQYAGIGILDGFAPFDEALKADPQAQAAIVTAQVESSRLKRAGNGGRVYYYAGFYDAGGILQFAGEPTAAPVIHFDGPLQITLYGRQPQLRVGREHDLMLMVGTPGSGPGTFAMIGYDDTIPETAYPQVAITYTAAERDAAPIKELYELKQRC